MVTTRRWCGVGLGLVLALCACSDDADDTARDAGLDAGFDAGPPRPALSLTCRDAVPAGAEQAPEPPEYSGGTCPVLTTGTTLNLIATGGMDREFMVVVPSKIASDEQLPVIFMWHWLNASAMSFYEQADVQNAVDEGRFIAVLPNGIGSLPANWPWSTITAPEVMEAEFVFFDDMLACVSQQFPVNKNCVASAGVSDGALWTSQLAGGRGEYLSSIVVLSGGVDSDFGIGKIRPWTPAAHKMPAIVLWGGPDDVCIVLQFEEASMNLEAALEADGHFMIECVHDCGHGVPPIEATGGRTQFAVLWDFVNEHPYWLGPGESPYLETGLPEAFPDWCAIGVGNATPRMGDGMDCSGPGC
jgi:predicted esterase